MLSPQGSGVVEVGVHFLPGTSVREAKLHSSPWVVEFLHVAAAQESFFEPVGVVSQDTSVLMHANGATEAHGVFSPLWQH
jgi:hypothetical protein